MKTPDETAHVERNVSSPTLRLAYQSFGQIGGMEAYQSTLSELVAATASPGSEISVLRLPSARVAGKGFASAQALEVPAILRSIAAAVDSGTEAVAIGNGFDPGLWEARELFDVPVLGLFETVALYSLRVGWRLGVLTSGKSGASRIEEMAARYGISSRLVSPVAVGVTVPTVVEAFTNAEVAAQVLAATDVALTELASRGADVVMVASGALDVFLHTHGMSTLTKLPVLPAVPILVRELEAVAGLARLGVTHASRTGRFAQAPQAVLESLRQPADT